MENKYTFENIRENGLLLYEYVRGSNAYGLSLPTSDIDTGGVYLMPKKDYYSILNDYPEQISDSKNDTVWYEVGRYLELLYKSNPNMIESLYVPDRCVRYITPAFEELRKNRELFLSKELLTSLCGYAKSQIYKARGLNKKIVNPVDTRKDILDFCYTFKGQGTTPFKKWLEKRGLKAKYCGLVHLPNMEQMYGVYYDWGNHILNEYKTKYFIDDVLLYYAMEYFDIPDSEDALDLLFETVKPIGYRGAMDENNDTTQLRLSSVEKGIPPICIIQYNENGFKTHCRQYKEYQQWVRERNPQRYLENKDKEFDRKNMMHCVRLLTMGIEIAKTGKVNVDRTDIDRDFLLNIRLGNTTYDEIIQYAGAKQVELDEAMKTCTLPDKTDIEKVKELLIDIRSKYYD